MEKIKYNTNLGWKLWELEQPVLKERPIQQFMDGSYLFLIERESQFLPVHHLRMYHDLRDLQISNDDKILMWIRCDDLTDMLLSKKSVNPPLLHKVLLGIKKAARKIKQSLFSTFKLKTNDK